MRLWLLPTLLCAACSKGPQADAPAVSEARSLTAEWALVNEQADQRKLTSTYVGAMHAQIREQLQQASKSLTRPQSDYGSEIESTLREPDDAAPAQLRTHAQKLKKIGDALESA